MLRFYKRYAINGVGGIPSPPDRPADSHVLVALSHLIHKMDACCNDHSVWCALFILNLSTLRIFTIEVHIDANFRAGPIGIFPPPCVYVKLNWY